MDAPQKDNRSSPSAAVFLHAAVGDIVYSPGRRGVRIFGLPAEQVTYAWVGLVILGIPFAIFLSMAPFWDRIGDLAPIKQLNFYVAPMIEAFSDEYRNAAFPRFPIRRFLVASASMVEIIFISNFFALSFRGVRRHALLVWTCYDRQKIFLYFGLSGLVFGGCWYALFVDWTVWTFLGSPRYSTRLAMCVIAATPVMALLFGHMTAIVGLGGWRTLSRTLGRLRRVLP